ncbi:MAG TPA: ABC transporter permease [Bryobacteraceae bacterium]|nr:ABC transporter permease [Bryobacteraceae bacterium]
MKRLVDTIRMRLRTLFSRASAEAELDEELQYHLDRQIEENVAAGMNEHDARSRALATIGGLQQRKEECRDARGWNVLDNARTDLRFALRQLSKSPGFTLTAVTILGSGIAASVAIFGLVDTSLLKPLPYRDPSRLVAVYETAAVFPRSNLSYPDYLDWKRQNTVFSGFDVYTRDGYLVSTPEGSQPAYGARVTDWFFRTLGVVPMLGADFSSGTSESSVMLSYSTWQKRFGARRDIVGQTVRLNGSPYTVIGVLPEDFHFAHVGAAEFWTAFRATSGCDVRRSCHSIYAVGRLREGVSTEEADAQLKGIAKRLEQLYPDSNRGQGALAISLKESIVGEIRPVLLLLLSGAVLLIAIAAINVASLLLVRADTRRREMSVRSALGASKGRLVSQLATEGLVLVIGGGVIGLFGGWAAMQMLITLVPQDMLESMPFLQNAAFSYRVAGFAAAVGLMAAVLFSVTPALRMGTSSVRAGLAESGRGSAGMTWRRLGAKLVVVEVAIAIVLLVGAGLMGKSLQRVLRVGVGFDPDRLATLVMEAPQLARASNEKQVAFGREAVRRLSELPGVQSAALTSRLPVAGNGNTDWIRFTGRPYNGEHNEVNQRSVTPAYFSTLRAKLVRGRYFTDADDLKSPRVAIINQKLAQLYFPGEDPIGKTFGDTSLTPSSIKEIVGVVEDIREGTLESEIWPAAYYAFAQDPSHYFAAIVRGSQEDASMLRAVEDTLRRIGPELAIMPGATMNERITESEPAYLRRSSTVLVGSFAGLAFLMSVVGLYGVIAYSVSQRTREIGVRMALGAERRSVYAMVLREAAVLASIGTVVGLVCSVGAATSIRTMLFEVEPWDAQTLLAVASILGIAAVVASFIPARRAASVNPVVALRAE